MMIKSMFPVLLLSGLLAQAMAQPSLQEYENRIKQINDDIYAQYYDSPAKLFRETNSKTGDKKPHSYLWPLCALVQAANEMERLQPGGSYVPPVMDAIDKYYSTKPPVPGYEAYVVAEGGDDRFYDDNQWVAIACLDAYNRTKQKKYLLVAQAVYRFMITGFDAKAGGGLYWKEGDGGTKNTCSNGPGILVALQLHRITRDKRYLDTALLLYQWVNKNLLSPEGLYYDAVKIPAGTIDKRYYTYNTGAMLQANVLLYSITGRKDYLQEAQRVAEAAINYFYKNGRYPRNHWFNAVLLRGYEELYKADGNKKYINSFISDADSIWKKEANEKAVTNPVHTQKLLDRAGLLEIYARLALLKKEGF